MIEGLLAQQRTLLDQVQQPRLTHDDLNWTNLLVARDADGEWRLSGLVEVDSAWAGDPASDLARLELWRGMTAGAFWQRYHALRSTPAAYAQRTALLQLLWCLEYAQATPEHHLDTVRVCAELGIPAVRYDGR